MVLFKLEIMPRRFFISARSKQKYLSKKLRSAVAENNLSNIHKYIKRGADVNLEHRSFGTPLYFAVNYNNIEIINILLEGGANPNMENTRGETPLSLAKRKGFTDAVKLLSSEPEPAFVKNENPEVIPDTKEKSVDSNTESGVGDKPSLSVKDSSSTLLAKSESCRDIVALSPGRPSAPINNAWSVSGSLSFPNLGILSPNISLSYSSER